MNIYGLESFTRVKLEIENVREQEYYVFWNHN